MRLHRDAPWPPADAGDEHPERDWVWYLAVGEPHTLRVHRTSVTPERAARV